MTESEATREMTFDEEYEILQVEKNELFSKENDNEEPQFANCVVRRALRCIRKLKEEVEQYRAIGTVEECRIAVEKHNKKIKPLKVHNRFVCPCCTNSRQEVILTEHTEYCFVCGQGFDWSEGE